MSISRRSFLKIFVSGIAVSSASSLFLGEACAVVNKTYSRQHLIEIEQRIRDAYNLQIDVLYLSPNDDNSRYLMASAVGNIMAAFMLDHKLQRYLVICDRSNNTDFSINRNDIIVDVYYTDAFYAKPTHIKCSLYND